MNVAVIGLGSMGKRRIRLIKQYSKEIVIYGIDISTDRRNECEANVKISTFSSLGECIVSNEITCVFISTSPVTHSGIIKECLERGIHVFTEINLVSDGYEENIRLAEVMSKKLFLSSTNLYREEVKYIMDRVKKLDSKLNYTYHIGQYLPDWHPWESYKNFFIGDKRTNGCREILAIELPWIIKCFGEITEVYTWKDKMTKLEIDYQDNYFVLIKHASGHKGIFTVDVVAPIPVSQLIVYGENVQIEWDGTPEGLYEYNRESKQKQAIKMYDKVDKLENYSSSIVENAYYNEIHAFFNEIEGKQAALYTFEDDLITLELLDRIEG